MPVPTQNRRQFIKSTGQASMAIAATPVLSVIAFNGLDLSGFQQRPLPYAYQALEPYIDAATMEIHYSKHGTSYANNLKDALVNEKVDANKITLTDLLKNISHYSTKMRNNAGGHYNHELFWQSMKPSPATTPSGTLAEAITKKFGSFDAFKTAFSDVAKTRFGSGWAWLLFTMDGSLSVGSTPNQDNPLMDLSDLKGIPLLGLDVWEHAYYLKYQNKRPDYITSWWNLVNWDIVQQRFDEANH